METEVYPAHERPEENVVLVDGSSASQGVGPIDTTGTHMQAEYELQEPEDRDDQIIAAPTEPARDHVTHDNTEQATSPAVPEGYTMANKEYVPNGTMEYVPNSTMEYVPNSTMEHASLPRATDGGYSTMVANDRGTNETTEQAFLPVKAEGYPTMAAGDYVESGYTQQALPAVITDGHSTMVTKEYVEIDPTETLGYADGGIVFDELPQHTGYDNVGVVSPVQGSQSGHDEVGIVFEGRTYQNRVFDENLGQYVYIAD